MERADGIGLAVWLAAGVCVSLWTMSTARAARKDRRLLGEERKLRAELDAYAALDAGVAPGGSPRALARRICATVGKFSALGRVAMLLRDAEQRLHVVGSAGIDDLLMLALDDWGERTSRLAPMAESERRKSYEVTLGPMARFDVTQRSSERNCRQMVVLPMWSQSGLMLGALVACPPGTARAAWDVRGEKMERMMRPLEMLAAKVARAQEVALLQQSLSRAEKMAGLAHLAKGVAHELNNPLMAVLGYAELIAETAAEPRAREDAGLILGEARRMRGTVDRLLQFWRPGGGADEPVDVAEVLRAVVAEAEAEMKSRGVAVVLVAENESCGVRGTREGLAEVFRQLLRNALRAGEGSDERSVRVAMSCDRENVRVVVSDTGAGFVDAAKVFDPFYTTMAPGDGQGLGLAVSYGIVREHGGEISAFNLHPQGAAVVVELPVARVLVEEFVGTLAG